MKNLKYILLTLFVASISCTEANAQFWKKKKPVETEQTQPVNESPEMRLRKAYNAALAKRDNLDMRIENMVSEMNVAKRSKAKKIGKELVKLQAERDATDRLIGTFPPSLTNPVANIEETVKVADEFRREMDRKLEEKAADRDIDREIIDDITDPELRRAYEKYQRTEGKMSTEQPDQTNMKLYYSVQIGSGKSGQAKTFRGVSGVFEKQNSKGNHIYCVGKYASESEAKRELEKIRSTTNYRDAYVVAFSDEKLISLDKARNMR